MKGKLLLSVLLMFLIISIKAQKPSITLTFTADSNAQHVPLNSILIENLTQGGDTTLYAPDTVLVLDYFTGLEEVLGKGFTLTQNYPNPMNGQTTIELHLPKNDKVLITVRDVIGREVINQKFQLEQGSHSFTFHPGKESLYFLTAYTNQLSHTIKMFNSPSHVNGTPTGNLEYNNTLKYNSSTHKSGIALNSFVFELGDMLMLTGNTSKGERVISSSPSGDKTYYFHYTGEPCPGIPTVTDIDGNIYNTIQIGSQCWMKENLKTTTYNNGTPIPNVTDPDEWGDLTSGAYVWHYNVITQKDRYGALYNWFTTVDPNGLCPTGWHVPTHDEWTNLTDYIGGTSSPHGNELKSCRQVNSPLGGGCNTSDSPRWHENGTHYGTDDYGFQSLPGGSRCFDGTFYGIGYYGYWWSSTEYSSHLAWSRPLVYYDGFVFVYNGSKQDGFSVRCLRD